VALTRIRRMVLVGHENEGSARLFDRVVEAYPDVEFLLVVGEGLYYKKSFLGSVIKLLREASWSFAFHRFIELTHFRLTQKTLTQRAKARGVRIIRTMDINGDKTVAEMKAFAPDLLVSLYTMQLYRKPALSVAKLGGITSHPSILPNYRGLEVFFWALANEESETGVSVFFLEEKIDAGRVFRQRRIPIRPDTTVASLYREVTDVAGELLVQAIADVDRDSITVIPQTGKGSYYRMPDRECMRRFRATGRKFS